MKTKLLLLFLLVSAFANATNTMSDLSATPTSATSAEISFLIQNNCINGYYTVQFSLNSSFVGTFFSATNSITDCSTTAILKTVNITGLSASTTYYYRIIAGPNTDATSNPDYSLSYAFITPAAASTHQLLAEYTFDNTLYDPNGTNPFISNGNPLTFGVDRNGEVNKALSVNVNAKAAAALSNLPIGNAARTISVWMKPNVVSNDNIVFTFGSTSNCDNTFGGSFSPSNIYNFNLCTLGNVAAANTVVANQWKHVVIAYSANTTKIYINGVYTAANNLAVNTDITQYFYLGNYFSATTSAFNGFFDDLKIYNYSLTNNQVLSLYNTNTLSSENFNQNDNTIVLYPNPAKDILNIATDVEIKSLEIYNIQGQKVLQTNIKQINVSDLASGFYLVNIQDKNNNKIIKKVQID